MLLRAKAFGTSPLCSSFIQARHGAHNTLLLERFSILVLSYECSSAPAQEDFVREDFVRDGVSLASSCPSSRPCYYSRLHLLLDAEIREKFPHSCFGR